MRKPHEHVIEGYVVRPFYPNTASGGSLWTYSLVKQWKSYLAISLLIWYLPWKIRIEI